MATSLPRRFAGSRSACLAVCLAACLGAPAPAAGDDFRVENKVYAKTLGGEKLTSRSTTLFHDGLVYDYLDQPAEVIVFDKPAGRFVLLDTARRMRTELSTGEVTNFTQQLKQAAETQKDPFLAFAAEPTLQEQFDTTTGELTLSSSFITYRLQLVAAPNEAVAEQYREFSDWLARVNTLLNPGGQPPFARLQVNAAMARRQATAREVQLTLEPRKTVPPKRINYRSEHHLVGKLAAADRKRVAQTRQFMRIFKPVGFQEYRRPQRP